MKRWYNLILNSETHRVLVYDNKSDICDISMNVSMNTYMIRYGDNLQKPEYLEKSVICNRFGYVLSKEELPEMELNYKNFKFVSCACDKIVKNWADI